MSALNGCCYACQVVSDIVSVTTINLSFPLQAYMCFLNQYDTLRKTLTVSAHEKREEVCSVLVCLIQFAFTTHLK